MGGCPARYDEELGHWVVEEPGLVREILLDPETFRPDNAVVAHTPLSVKALRVLSSVGFALPPTLANNAGPSHRPIRAAVARFFSPARVAAVEPLARRLVSARVDAAWEALAEGPIDLVQAIAAEPPAMVLLDLLHLHDVDIPSLKAWSQDSLELFWGRPSEDRQLELAHSAAEFYAWLRRRVEDARRTPGDDLFGVLTRMNLTDEEICAVAYFLLIAGQETTTQLISTTFHRTLTHPQPPTTPPPAIPTTPSPATPTTAPPATSSTPSPATATTPSPATATTPSPATPTTAPPATSSTPSPATATTPSPATPTTAPPATSTSPPPATPTAPGRPTTLAATRAIPFPSTPTRTPAFPVGPDRTTGVLSAFDDFGAVVERVLAEASSVPTWRRITAARVSVGGTEVPAGAPVLLGLTGHGGPADLAFGVGIHRCLGAGLARLEARIALECAAPLLAAVRAVEPEPPMIDLLSFRAPARLLVQR